MPRRKAEVLPKFYTYELAYPESMGGAVFYVGKGTGDRINGHEREAKRGADSKKCAIIREIWDQDEQVIKRKVYQTEIEQDAYFYEWILVNLVYGYEALANEGEGGNGGPLIRDITHKLVCVTLPRHILQKIKRMGMRSYIQFIIAIHLPDQQSIDEMMQLLPFPREAQEIAYRATTNVYLPIHLVSRIEAFPSTERSLVIERLVLTDLEDEEGFESIKIPGLLARRLRSEVPDKHRSALVAKLIEQYLDEKQREQATNEFEEE